ncbi:hypothetical protein FY406_03200 [Streptococcus ratti]|nr:hypothetical protein FY406_03200 [Streptococcus ratti]
MSVLLYNALAVVWISIAGVDARWGS